MTDDVLDLDALLARADGIVAHHQPIVRLRDDEVVGYEALARMETSPRRGPDVWLHTAAEQGRRAELEVACCVAAVQAGLPPDDGLLFVNLSPSLLGDPRVADALGDDCSRLVLELSEQEQIDDYESLAADVARWQERGARIAVDDTGSGYASLRHVLRLSPDFIKLDRSLVDGIDQDSRLRAFVASFVAFARGSGSFVIAEGVETRDQLEVLREAGVQLAQGYLLGRPAPGWGKEQAASALLRLDRCTTPAEASDAVCDHLHALGVMPSVYLERDGLLRCVAQRGLWQVLDGMPPGVGVTGLAFRDDRLVVVEDVRGDDQYLEAIPDVVAEACMPLRAHGRTIGALNIDTREPLDGHLLHELQRCARLLGERLQVLDRGADSGPLARLVSASVAIERSASRDDLVETLLEAAVDVADMSTAVVISRARVGGAPALVARGPLAEALTFVGADELESLLHVVVPVRSCYSAGDERAVGFVGTDGLREAGARTVVIVPMRHAGESSLLAVLSPERKHLHTDRIEVLELLAAHAAARLETISYISELRRRAEVDALTGVGNRSAFADELDGWRRTDGRGAVVLLDVDRFKAINDTYGHLEGDRVLVDLAAAFTSTVRPGDGVYRLGGDEFAVLLPGSPTVEAVRIAERLQLAAGAVLSEMGAGLSFGVSTVGDRTTEEALREADRRLYDAKRTPRLASSRPA